jgi:hypothetical protein
MAKFLQLSRILTTLTILNENTTFYESAKALAQ